MAENHGSLSRQFRKPNRDYQATSLRVTVKLSCLIGNNGGVPSVRTKCKGEETAKGAKEYETESRILPLNCALEWLGVRRRRGVTGMEQVAS